MSGTSTVGSSSFGFTSAFVLPFAVGVGWAVSFGRVGFDTSERNDCLLDDQREVTQVGIGELADVGEITPLDEQCPAALRAVLFWQRERDDGRRCRFLAFLLGHS